MRDKQGNSSEYFDDEIWITPVRRCWVHRDTVGISPPMLFGRGFLFDGTRQVVTVRRCLLRLPLSKQEIPFSDVTVRVGTGSYRFGYGGEAGRTLYSVKMDITSGGEFQLCTVGFDRQNADDVVAAVRWVLSGETS
jgi:hypothetical protein